ncbi:penicillin amidase [Micromonospora pallida]|uniref:Penicillin amidase n=1 Tax=Micromonospora pallida TaxID=145854 RepID=A0A1C6SD23_9ACTN|nr:penicillin acylase family protein [Micromonospora pallida]SCL27388.1 penicillin amidase [Micromonospora pallida]
MTAGDGTVQVRGRDGSHAVVHHPGAVISAEDWTGAALGLGFQMATDRPGQLDFLRRSARGRLAQLVGRDALDADVRQRRLGLEAVARRCLTLLPPDQVRLLDAFTDGVNTALRQRGSAMTWAPVDCVHVAQVLFQAMGSNGSELHMTEVMRRSLPSAVVDFLLDAADGYATAPDGSPEVDVGVPLPLAELRVLFRQPADQSGGPVVADPRPAGSNAWAVAAPDGAVLANDMHLQLGDPALMYVVRLRVGETEVSGVTVPGLPVVLAGTNGRVAWGLTRLPGDTADLRSLGPQDLADVEVRRETIEIRGESPVTVEVTQSRWGPVTSTLAGEPVAFTATLLDPRALDFGLLRLCDAADVETALDIVNDCGLPPVNAIVADAAGRVGWTVGGRFPHRAEAGRPRGFSDAQEPVPYRFVPPHELPRLVGPPTGMVVNCNNGNHAVRRAGLAWNLPPGIRARRVAVGVDGGGRDAAAARDLQLDVDASCYEFYRDLALRYLPPEPRTAALREIREDVMAWGGTAHAREPGLALLTVFRELLREALVAAATGPARALDDRFTYCFAGAEGPLRRLVAAVPDGLVPAPWRDDRHFVVGQLLMARMMLLRDVGTDRLPQWGQRNRLHLVPLAGYPPEAVDLELSGCAETVRVAQPDYGAVMRLVVDLGRPGDSSVCIPGSPREGVPMAEAVRSWAVGYGQPLTVVPAGYSG